MSIRPIHLSLVAVATLAGLAPLAHADNLIQIVGQSRERATGSEIPPAPMGTGFGTRAAVRGVVTGDQLSINLQMRRTGVSTNNLESINSLGNVRVTRGSTLTPIGSNTNNSSSLLASWDEIVEGNSVFVSVIIRTNALNQPIVPLGSVINDIPGNFATQWRWNIGEIDPINFGSWVTSVSLVSATAFFSQDHGTSYFSSLNYTAALPSNFNPGVDAGPWLSTIGDGTNQVLLRYQLNIVPAPGGLALLGAAGLIASRRRR